MAKPKLALIPAAIGTKLYSVLPSNGSGDFTFTRGSAATRINAQGLIETVANTSSRLNYPLLDGKVVGCPHNLLEPQRINLITYSESFSNAFWTKTGASIVLNSTISPDGSLNASKLVEDNTNSLHAIFQNAGITIPAGNNTLSVFVKSNGRNFFQVRTGSAGGVDNSPLYANFDLINNTETASSVGVINSKIETYPNNWKKISITFNLSSGTSVALVFQPILYGTSVINESYQGDGTSGVYIFGAQLEASSFPTSYIKSNSGSATTRLGEIATGSGNSTTFNDSEGVLMAEIAYLKNRGTSSPFKVERISISDSSDTNRIFISNTATANQIQVFVRNSVGISFNKIVTISDNTLYNKIVLKYKANDYSLWINGFELESDNTYNYLPSGLNVLKFEGAAGEYDFYGNVKQTQYFDSALADTQLEQLTSWQSFSDMAEGQLYTIE